ncbi:MAG: 30S ribosome-binding factor RbfA [Rhodospirillales bacterium]|nr:30S ribosome-binding factor RbfA [Rhodospirillales bacterium]
MLRDGAGCRLTRGGSSGAGAPKGAPSQRQLRVAEAMRHELAGLLARGELRDPALHDANITVTSVSVSPDLRRATAFVTRLGRSDVGVLLPVLNRGAAHLRGAIARALKLRLAPEIVFVADTTLDQAAGIEALLRSPEVARDLGPHPDDGKT